MIEWQWSRFDELSCDDLYEILKARQAVFVVEQECAYQDVDDLDRVSWHLIGWRRQSDAKSLVAYSRVVFPGQKYPEPSIGRVLTLQSTRGTGLGQRLTHEAISRTTAEYPDAPIRISAQQVQQRFYMQFGFATVSDPYDEDGIPHVEMLRDGVI